MKMHIPFQSLNMGMNYIPPGSAFNFPFELLLLCSGSQASQPYDLAKAARASHWSNYLFIRISSPELEVRRVALFKGHSPNANIKCELSDLPKSD